MTEPTPTEVSSVSSPSRVPCGMLTADDVGRSVRLQAWVQRRRDLGGLLFLDLRDRSGVVQVVVHPEEQAELTAAFEPVRAEWVVEIVGEVAHREAGNVNPDMATGEIEVKASSGQILSRSKPVPFSLDGKIDVEATEETRLAHRYLDLRRPELQRNMILRDEVTLAIRNYFHENGFIDVETPILTRATPEGARDYLVPSRVHRGSFYALPQSPQIYKQLLMVSGFERYVQIARCFRDEDLRADRQPEFTQVDVEMSFVDEEDVFELLEGLFHRIFPLVGIQPPEVFPLLTWQEAMDRFGSDKPDLRFGMEIQDLTDELGESGFRGFSGAVADGGVIRGIAIPADTGAVDASRKQVEEWAEVARRHGAAGVLTLKKQDGEVTFQVKKALTDDEARAAADALELEDGAMALIAAGPFKTTATALGALRNHLARQYDLIPDDAHSFLWVHRFPLFEWDEETQRYYSVNHPFTAPAADEGSQDELLAKLAEDPASVVSRGYDVVMDGVELGGGSIRIHDTDLQAKVFEVLGMSDDEARRRFGFLLDALAYGAPPHGGFALGLDRIIMLMAGAGSLRDVIAFPKTASASDLMNKAPAPVDERQLRELGLEVEEKAAADAADAAEAGGEGEGDDAG